MSDAPPQPGLLARTLGKVVDMEQKLGAALNVIADVLPSFPALRITDMDIGLPHAHAHPPNLIPPAPPVPLPSTGPVISIPVLSGAKNTFINGLPAARCGDLGLGVWCGGYFPLYEVFLGSSNVWIEGQRAGRMGVDITKHCIFTSPRPSDPPMGPMFGTTITGSMNVLIGGVPMPSLLSLGIAAAFKGLGKLVGAGARGLGRLGRRVGRNMRPGFLKCKILRAEPVNVVTGEVIVGQFDFVMPGRIPLLWTRRYTSGSDRKGCCGRGWDTPADARLVFHDDGTVSFHDGGPGASIFPALPTGAPVREYAAGALLGETPDGLEVVTAGGVSYHFPLPAPGDREVLLRAIRDRFGNSLDFQRESGNLLHILESRGRRLHCVSRNGLLNSIFLFGATDEHGRRLVSFAYDADGNLTTVYDAAGTPCRFAYTNGLLTTQTSRAGVSFHYEYEGTGGDARCVRTYGDNGLYDYSFRYDVESEHTRVTDSLNNVTDVWYDDRCLITREIDPLGGCTSYEYDSIGRTTAVIDPLGNRREYGYDDSGELVRETDAAGGAITAEYNGDQLVTRMTNALGHTWSFEWDPRGNLMRRVTPRGAEWSYTYDPHGAMRQVTDPLGGTTRFRTDRHGDLVSSLDAAGFEAAFTVDSLGNVLSATHPGGVTSSWTYDINGLVSTVQLSSGVVTTFGHNPDGHIAEIETAGSITRLEYSGLGQVSRRVNPDDTAVTFNYDTEERLIEIANERGETFTLTLDGLGSVIAQTDYWGCTSRSRYDACARLIEKTDPAGRVMRYRYDAAGRLIARLAGDRKRDEYRYDPGGRLVGFSNRSATVQRTYNEDNLLTSETLNGFTFAYEYDLAGNCVRRNSSNGNSVTYEYDTAGGVSSIAINGRPIWRIEPASAPNVRREILGERLIKLSTYDDHGRLSRQQLTGAPDLIVTRRYAYDETGNLVERGPWNGPADRFEYDALGRIRTYTGANGDVRRFTYDAAGDLGWCAVSSNDSGMRRVVKYDGLTYMYNECGNLIRRDGSDAAWTFEWDESGALQQATAREGVVVGFEYDSFGRRVARQSGSRVRRFFWDGDRLGAQVDEDGSGMEFVYFPDSFIPIACLTSAGKVYFYVNDNVGLPYLLLNAQGRAAWSATYGPFGDCERVHAGEIDNPLRFPGQYHDTETGLYYTRYRYYDPLMKVFISQDPLAPYTGSSLYDYAPNPWIWIDPFGLVCLDNNILSLAHQGNPSVIAFLRNNAGNLRFGRVSRYEFLRMYTRRELSAMMRNYGLVFDNAASYRNIIADASTLRSRFTDGRVLHVMDSRQAATARAMNEALATADEGLYKRARDLGLPAQYVDTMPGAHAPSAAANRCANYVPRPV